VDWKEDWKYLASIIVRVILRSCVYMPKMHDVKLCL
jgi:hypothetical protein